MCYDFVPVRKRRVYRPSFVAVIDGEAARVKDAGIGCAVGGSGSVVYDVAVSVRPMYVAIVYADKAADAHSFVVGYGCNFDINVRNARDYRPTVGSDKSAERAIFLCGIPCQIACGVAADYRREVMRRKCACRPVLICAKGYFRSHQVYVLDHRFRVCGIIVANANVAKQPVLPLQPSDAEPVAIENRLPRAYRRPCVGILVRGERDVTLKFVTDARLCSCRRSRLTK